MNISQLLTKLKALIYSKSETDSLLGGKANSSHTHTKSQITDFPSLAIVATSGSYNDLSNKPTIRNDILHYASVSSLDADTISEDGIWYVTGAITGAPLAHYGVFLNVKTMGTPFQMYFPDHNLYVYKRITTSDGWSSWEKMNARSWDDVSGKPSTFTPSSHTHTKSQITDFPAYGTTAGTICEGNDSRLSDARTPYFANGTWYAVGDDAAIGDHNVSGGLGVKALIGNTTRIDLCYKDDAANFKSITYDGTTLYMNGNCDYASSAGSVNTSVAAGSTKNLVYASMSDNDQCRIMCGGASDAGYMEIATADNGSEPIYVRQYNGTFGSIVRTLTLLDGYGNTILPGSISLQGSYQIYVG